MSRIYDIANEYVEKMAALDPVAATTIGVAGHDHEMTDYSPDGSAALYELDRSTLSALASARQEGERDRIAKEVMEERLKLRIEQHGAGEHLRSLNILFSPLQNTRRVFDLMPRATDGDWHNIATRLKLVPQALASYRATLIEGMQQGLTAAQRQALECAAQAEVWAGQREATPFFNGLVSAYADSGLAGDALRRELDDGARAATDACVDIARFIRDAYAPRSTPRDPVGSDRYQLASRWYNGIQLDLEQTYEWGWDQLGWVESEMTATARRILPGSNVDAAKRLLESDPNRAIEGVDAFRGWMQTLQEQTMSDLEGRHFDLPGPIKQIEAMIAPPGGALAMYYTGPSEDFSRPGRTWYPTGGRTRFPLWREVSIAYHEGVPGHHFQIATTKYLKDDLSRYQRLLAGTSGYVEGWALYAERLMGELGYLENPDYYLGMLSAQALRSVRVIIDIGMHLELRIPRNQRFHAGEIWSPQLGFEFIRERSHFPADFVASEVTRYLGIPGQAISYKVGERSWLDARENAKRQPGSHFDLKAWHNRALNLGPMGLAQMQREIGRG